MPADPPHCCCGCDCNPPRATITIGDVTYNAAPGPKSWTITFPTWQMARMMAKRITDEYPAEGLTVVRRGRSLTVSLPHGECGASIDILLGTCLY